MRFVRSLAFSIAFYGWTALLCLLLVWTLLLPRHVFFWELRLYLRTVAAMERLILGLDYRIVDRNRLPKGAFILAAKHQSAWETFKLHVMFEDPVIVVKQELMRIPLWGWFLRRTHAIGIDRSSRGRAIREIVTNARPHIARGRPIVVFPQGTRTAPGQYCPYQIGVFALYKALDLPVVPMALNSGVYWPRHRLVKHGGTVIVQFLDPIPPGLDRKAFMTRLETQLESASDTLVVAAGGPPTPRPPVRAGSVVPTPVSRGCGGA